MTESDYALYKDEVDADGNPLYSQTDVVGQDGMEKLYEKELNGVDGKVLIEVDNQGRRMSVIDSTACCRKGCFPDTGQQAAKGCV